MEHWLFFSVDDTRCAMPLASTQSVIPMLRLIEGPDTKKGVAGFINLHGRIIPVYSLRSFLGIPERTPGLSDMLVIANTGTGTVALWVDETHVEQQSPVFPANAGKSEVEDSPIPGMYLRGDDTIVVHDLSLFLDGHDDEKLHSARSTIRRTRGGVVTAPPEIVETDTGRVEAGLAERARKLAQPEPGTHDTELVEVLRFRLAYQEYALEMKYVQEVILTGEITPVPGVPDFISGICAARGQIISLVDLRVLFSLPERGLTDLNRVIVMTDRRITFGILADNISGIGTIPFDLVMSPDPEMMPERRQYLKGVVNRDLIVLDAAAILTDPAMVVEDT